MHVSVIVFFDPTKDEELLAIKTALSAGSHARDALNAEFCPAPELDLHIREEFRGLLTRFTGRMVLGAGFEIMADGTTEERI